jgi:RHH-type proline utilization regulon transcriptional repressor/proline dehydrogenase/delta 1-pyrroline-5-carboxylate dehydrogenase
MSSNGQVNLESFLLNLTFKKYQDWNIFYYKEYETLLLDNLNLCLEVTTLLDKYISTSEMSFRTQQSIRSTPFLLGVFVDKKEIRFYTPKLSSELFLLQQGDIINIKHQSIQELRSHTEMAAALSYKNFPTEIESLITAHHLPNLFSTTEYVEVDKKANDIIKKLLIQINSYQPSWFEDLTDFGLGLTAQYALLRIHLLKFLAILPSLDHDTDGKEVKRILLEALFRFLKDNKNLR